MKLKTRVFHVSAAIALALLLGLPAGAARAQGTEQQRSDCEGDAFRLCSADIPNVPAIEACLASKEAELSPACRAEFRPARKTRLRREHFPT
ncbi:MAG TPA: hypothetical protein VMI47_03310 [Pseudolabrys sp.]|nr:hypothetical protein [Pseudolabrys sp.]